MSGQPDPQPTKADAAAALTPLARRLHLAILTAFTAGGAPPPRTAIDRAARDLHLDPGTLIAELADRDLVAFDQRGEVRAAYPFSPKPTRHAVTWHGGPQAHAMCAIDALGISAMISRRVTIASTEPDTGKPLTVHVDGDRARWTPDTAVVYAGAAGEDTCCPSADRTCDHINFFTTADAAHAWAARRPDLTGAVLRQSQAVASAVVQFGKLMQSPDSR